MEAREVKSLLSIIVINDTTRCIFISLLLIFNTTEWYTLKSLYLKDQGHIGSRQTSKQSCEFRRQSYSDSYSYSYSYSESYPKSYLGRLAQFLKHFLRGMRSATQNTPLSGGASGLPPSSAPIMLSMEAHAWSMDHSGDPGRTLPDYIYIYIKYILYYNIYIEYILYYNILFYIIIYIYIMFACLSLISSSHLPPKALGSTPNLIQVGPTRVGFR